MYRNHKCHNCFYGRDNTNIEKTLKYFVPSTSFLRQTEHLEQHSGSDQSFGRPQENELQSKLSPASTFSSRRPRWSLAQLMSRRVVHFISGLVLTKTLLDHFKSKRSLTRVSRNMRTTKNKKIKIKVK